MELELAPRYVPNDEFSIAGFYRYRSKGADSYSGTLDMTSADSTPLTLDASILNTGTSQKEQVLGFSVTYSTVRGYARGTSKWPLEVWYLHSTVMSGTSVPKIQMNGIGLRIYRPGRSRALKVPPTPPTEANPRPPAARERVPG